MTTPPGGSSASAAKKTGTKAADSAEESGQQVIASRPFRLLLTVGLVAYGVVHILIGWIALQIAWSGGGEGQEASQKGALAQVAGQSFGAVLLWIIVVGLFALTLWQAIEAIWGHRDRPAGPKRIRKQLGSAGRAISYAIIAVAAISTLQGSAGSGDSSEKSLSARLMANTAGRLLVIAIGITIIVLAVRLIRRGVQKKFTEDLAGGVSKNVVRLGQAGYIVKGIAYAVVGGLFGWAGITFDPDKAGGLDDALRTVHEAPFGAVLLTIMALGLIAFGAYCFFWARHPRVSTNNGGARNAASS
ncbi:MAG: DUF1206 domain-containing protein [Nakamurella sp.]